MLFSLTSLVAFVGMAVTLWMGTYLLARGFNSLIALRAVAIMLALALYFMSAYFNLYHPLAASSSWREINCSTGMPAASNCCGTNEGFDKPGKVFVSRK